MRITKENIAIIDSDECISKWVEKSGRLDHDQSLLPCILKYISSDSVVIDAGAFIGDHTIAYAQKAKRVLAFEPCKSNFECLKHNLGDFENVELFNKGLSDVEGYISIKEVETNAGMAYAEKAKKGIKCVTIDSINLECLDLIKIDCEGFEYNILKGGEETILKYKPIMVIEINNFALMRNGITDNDLYIYLDSIGYNIRNIYEGHPIHANQLDLLCIPKQ